MELNIATLSLHADSHNTPDITAPLHVSTTFKYPKGFNDAKAIEKGYLKQDPIHIDDFHIYSRMTTETRTRLEQVLGSYENSYATSYSSGLAAIYALLTNVQPKIIAMHKEGYHGTHGTVELYSRNRDIKIIYVEDENLDLLNAGDLLLLESPMNPRGEVYDIRAYKNIIKEGVVLAVDSTFCPPPLQTLHSHGADIVMHSSTKFLGGHSDLTGGVLTTMDKSRAEKILKDRVFLGSVMGNMEAWLLLRSLRTLKVRVQCQSDSAAFLANWLQSKSEPCLDIVETVWHASLPEHQGHQVSKKQGSGWSGVLSISFKSLHHARLICNNLELLDNATSLGGVESLIEWRAAVDSKISPKLCRISIGLEDRIDLQNDFRQGFLKVAKLVSEMQ